MGLEFLDCPSCHESKIFQNPHSDDNPPIHCQRCNGSGKIMKYKKATPYDDAYWLRRWAGDAMAGLLARDVLHTHESEAEWAVDVAYATLKAFKEKEKDEGSN